MWLFAEYLGGLLIVIQGLQLTYALGTHARCDPCIAQILSCDFYRQNFTPSREKNLEMFTEIEDLNEACRDQAAFLICILQAENFCKQTIFSPVAGEMIKSRLFPAEICRPASPWQQLYLKEASCFNAYSREAFAYCVDKIFGVDVVYRNNSAERKCRHRRSLIECSASTLQGKCGYFAENILKKYLMFFSLDDYRCSEFTPAERDQYIFSSPDYDITKEFILILEAEDFECETTERSDMNKNLRNSLLHHHESQICSVDSISTETTLPKYHDAHRSKTAFALYEDLNVGHMRYMGCGGADFFWAIILPLTNKHCSLTDLKSDYSEAIFKCTIRFDAPYSLKLDCEDGTKMAQVFHRMYEASPLTPLNNQLSEDMSIMNLHYRKLHPSLKMHVPEKKVNLGKAQEHNTIEKIKFVSRKGSLEPEDDRSDILYQHRRGSGQEWDKDGMDSLTHLDEDEYYDEYESWDYPLEKEDVYFPHLRANNIIYIEDDKGDLISLHDHRSPIYSKSVYRPHSMFRPVIGTTPSSTNHHNFEKSGKVSQNTIFKKRESEFHDASVVSEVEHDKQESCSRESPCAPNSGFKIKPGMYILSRNIETFDPFERTNQLRQRIPPSIKLNEGIYFKPFLISRDVYVVTPSVEIEVSKSTDSRRAELHKDEFVTGHSKYSSEEDEFATDGSRYLSEDGAYDIQDYRYLAPNYRSSVMSTPNSVNSKSDYIKPFREYYIDAFTRPTYLYKDTSTTENPEDTIDPWNLNAESTFNLKSLWVNNLAEIIKISKALFENIETPVKRELLKHLLF